MADQLVAEGGIADIGDLANFDSYYSNGERGRLNVYLRASAPSSVLSELQGQLNSRGVLSTVTQEGRTVYINFTHGGISGVGAIGLWPALAAIAIVLVLVLAILIISWQLFKTASTILGPVLPILLLGVGVYLLARTFKKKGKLI